MLNRTRVGGSVFPAVFHTTGTLLDSGPEGISYDPFLVLDPQGPETLRETLSTGSLQILKARKPLFTTCDHSHIVSAWEVPGPLWDPNSVPIN